MYIPDHFEETDLESIKSLLQDYPLAIITAMCGDGLVAHHIPLLMEEDNRLIGHIAFDNTLHKQISDKSSVLVIFRAEDAYISPNWYPSKQQDGKQVPTWNYQIVHLEGRISFQHDEKTKRAVVGKMTKYFETRANGENAWKMSDSPRDYMTSQLTKIVALEISITRIMGKSKLNQNKTAEDRKNVASMLKKTGNISLSEQMLKRQ